MSRELLQLGKLAKRKHLQRTRSIPSEGRNALQVQRLPPTVSKLFILGARHPVFSVPQKPVCLFLSSGTFAKPMGRSGNVLRGLSWPVPFFRRRKGDERRGD